MIKVWEFIVILAFITTPGKKASVVCSESRVVRLMKATQLRSIRGYKRPRYRVGRPFLVSPNQLQCQFTHYAPDQAWVTDIIYICTHERWLYLSVVIEIHSRGNG
jgi:putative transposase